MAERNCKFCGEPGHNIRSCPKAERTKFLAEKFSGALLEEAPRLVEKNIPKSSFAGSMISNRLELSRRGVQSVSGSIPYGIWANLRSSFAEKVEKHVPNPGALFDELFEHVKFEVPAGSHQEVSFFVSGESYSKPFRGEHGQMELAGGLKFHMHNFIQRKLEEPADNIYKRLWSNICSANLLEKQYKNYEGKESHIVLCFLQGFFRKLKQSAEKKRTAVSPLFWTITGQLSPAYCQPALLTSMLSLKGEWINTEIPEFKILFEWPVDSVFGAGLSALDKQKISDILENTSKKAVQDCYFEKAKATFSPYRKQDSLNSAQLQLIMQPHAPLPKNHYFEKAAYEGGALYCDGPDAGAAKYVADKLSVKTKSINNLAKELVRMAHSGGYWNQACEGGVLHNLKDHFRNIHIDTNLNIFKAEDTNSLSPVRYISANCWDKVEELHDVSLADVVNAGLEALCNAEKEIL